PSFASPAPPSTLEASVLEGRGGRRGASVESPAALWPSLLRRGRGRRRRQAVARDARREVEEEELERRELGRERLLLAGARDVAVRAPSCVEIAEDGLAAVLGVGLARVDRLDGDAPDGRQDRQVLGVVRAALLRVL